MHNYRNILFATDLGDDSTQIGARAVDLAQRYSGTLTLFHVIELAPLDITAEGIGPRFEEIETLMRERAEERIKKLNEDLAFPGTKQCIVSGSTKIELLRHAQENHIDLIVVGKHTRHGLARLLGSTANAVLHNAPCDVLAVNLGGT